MPVKMVENGAFAGTVNPPLPVHTGGDIVERITIVSSCNDEILPPRVDSTTTGKTYCLLASAALVTSHVTVQIPLADDTVGFFAALVVGIAPKKPASASLARRQVRASPSLSTIGNAMVRIPPICSVLSEESEAVGPELFPPPRLNFAPTRKLAPAPFCNVDIRQHPPNDAV